MSIAGIILAAGRSSRFGQSNKLLADINGLPLIRHVVAALDTSNLSDLIVVVPSAAADLKRAAGDGRWRFVENADAAQGLASSLRLGLNAMPPTVDGALIALADMPFVEPDLVALLCSVFEANERRLIVFPEDDAGRQGHPVIWPRALFAELAAVTGDGGGKTVLKRHFGLAKPVRTMSRGAYFDIDTKDDLDAATQRKC